MSWRTKRQRRTKIDWHRVFSAFGACAWLYAPVPPCELQTRKDAAIKDPTSDDIKRLFDKEEERS